MRKIIYRILALLMVVALLVGCGFGGWSVYQNYHGGSVEVFEVAELSTTYWGDEKQTEGFVTTDQLQTEYLSDTQTVEEIKVTEGQRVKKGDVLFTYDSTLNDLDLKHKQIELQKKQLEIQDAQKELKVIRTYRAGVPIPGSSSGYKPSKPSKPARPEKEKPTYPGLFLVSGTGTAKDPYCYIWKENFLFTDDLLAAAMQGKDSAFVKFYLNGKAVTPVVPQPEPEPEPDDDDPSEGDSSEEPGDSSEGDSSEEPGDSSEGDSSEEPGDSSEGDSSEEPGDASEGDSSEGEASVEETAAQRMIPVLSLLSTVDEPVEELEEVEDAPGEEEDEDYSVAWTMHCQHTMAGYRYVMTSMTIGGVDRTVSNPLPAISEEERYQDDSDDEFWDDWGGDDFVDGIVYTAAEIADMIKSQEETLKTLDIEYRQLQLETSKLEKEVGDSAVHSKLDGVVTLLTSPDELEQGMPIVKVSGGGGYRVEGKMSELDLNNIQLGQSVTVNDWMSGSTYSGTIESISDYPAANTGYYWGEGNNNVSYYAFTVSVGEDANLEENSYVDMSYTPNVNGSSNIYLMKAFVRSENGKNYVYLDEDGTLTKTYVTTGRDLWGSYIEITSGNVPSEGKVAFPYGQKVRDKAPTTPGSMESLYGY